MPLNVLELARGRLPLPKPGRCVRLKSETPGLMGTTCGWLLFGAVCFIGTGWEGIPKGFPVVPASAGTFSRCNGFSSSGGSAVSSFRIEDDLSGDVLIGDV